MPFFYFPFENSPELDAPKAYREILRRDGITGVEMAKRAGVTRGAVGKLLGGRPLSPHMLKAIRAVMTEESACRFLFAHLRDEIRRAGEVPENFTIVQHDRSGPVLRRILEQLAADPERVRDLIELSAKWEKDALASTLETSRPEAPVKRRPSPSRKSLIAGKPRKGSNVSDAPERLVD